MFRFPALCRSIRVIIVGLGMTAGIAAADDCEQLVTGGLPYFAPRTEFDSPPLKPTATLPSKDGTKTAISSGLMKITTTVNGVTFDSNYDNGSLYSVSSGGTNIFNLGLF